LTAGDQSLVPLRAELKETIDSFDRAFCEGRLDELLALFSTDAQLLIHQQETVIGGGDPSALRPSVRRVRHLRVPAAYEIIDVHGSRAYVLVSF
jgi:hypothetical protein